MILTHEMGVGALYRFDVGVRRDLQDFMPGRRLRFRRPGRRLAVGGLRALGLARLRRVPGTRIGRVVRRVPLAAGTELGNDPVTDEGAKDDD